MKIIPWLLHKIAKEEIADPHCKLTQKNMLHRHTQCAFPCKDLYSSCFSNQTALVALSTSLRPHFGSLCLAEINFLNLSELRLYMLFCKFAFLASVMSVRSIVLCPSPSFLPKVVFFKVAFHLNKDIILPSLCPAPKHPKVIDLHCLDLVRAIRVLLTGPIRKTDFPIVLSSVPHKGHSGSRSTITRWISQLISSVYTLKDKAPLALISAQTPRSVGVSWVFQHQACVVQLCKSQPPGLLLKHFFCKCMFWP